MKFCTAMTAALSLPATMIPRVAAALESDTRPSVIWLEFQSSTPEHRGVLRLPAPRCGDRPGRPVGRLLETIGRRRPPGRGGQGQDHQGAGQQVHRRGGRVHPDEGQRRLLLHRRPIGPEIAREVCNNALATIAVGTCASYGGLPAAAPNPSGAVGVGEAVPGITLVNLPGCPLNTDNLVATIVHFIDLRQASGG